MVELICKELKVTTDVGWLGSDGRYYRIIKSGELFVYDDDNNQYIESRVGWDALMTSRLKVVHAPENGTDYYYPSITDGLSLYRSDIWSGNKADYKRLENGFVFDNIKEAIACAENLLTLWKENR